ncbi:hypothetical protein [Mesorhizobium sp.]|uniref:hypothetical protein n=1 Tax=Mesorhizobium sp. TaxID=1871066 RepID=UPI0025D55543|nr:hypothetical protein [Mesorhizobium sp.]
MKRTIVSKSDKSISEGSMSTQALNDAKTWLEVLHDAEFRGRKDTDGAARYRLAKRLGVKENYLFRLQYRAAEMRDVAGEVYRRLGLAYEEICERNEKAADAYRAERLDLRKTNAVDQKPASAGLGKGALGD